MGYAADLHFHSRFSRACSKDLTIPNLALWAKLKGINLLISGDFLHPVWFSELKGSLTDLNNGFYEYEGIKFVLGGEISTIYSHQGRTRRVHQLVMVSSMERAQKLAQVMLSRGVNLSSDGRPILGLSSRNLLELCLSVDSSAIFIPAHIWTPHFGVFGSESGYDSLRDCFEDLTEYVYGIETGLSCYDEETEVLTDDGWKKFYAVQYKDKICTLNLKTNKIELQKPTKIHSYQYKGKMYRLKTGRVDLLVTPNHKLLVSGCDFRRPLHLFLKEAEFLIGKSKRFKKDGIWVGTNLEYFTLPAVQIRHGSRYYSGKRIKTEKRLPIKPWLKFFGFWIAEGWTNRWISKDNKGDYSVCLANNNNLLLSEMKSILESFGYQVYWDQKINHTLRVRDYQLYSYLKQFGGSGDKFIPSEVKSLSKELLEIFFEYYIKGDGHRYGWNRKGLSATTISVRLRDDLQEVALKLGMSAYYRLHNKKGTPFKSPGYNYQKEYLQSADSWVIYFIRRNIHTVLPSSIKKSKYVEKLVDFDGKVFCVTVPNHAVYIRRKGIPVWCGNSDPAMNWRIKELDHLSIVSFSDAHSLAKLGRELTVMEGDLSSGYQGLWEALKNQQITETVEFYPEEGKYHYSGHRGCRVVYGPADEKEKGIACPQCGRKLTVGVMSRVEEIASRSNDELRVKRVEGVIKSRTFPQRPGYRMLVPLLEVISEALSATRSSKKVGEVYQLLVGRLGGEFRVLTQVPVEEINQIAGGRIAEGIDKARRGDLQIEPGYDGVYGVVRIWEDVNKRESQIELFD